MLEEDKYFSRGNKMWKSIKDNIRNTGLKYIERRYQSIEKLGVFKNGGKWVVFLLLQKTQLTSLK